MQYWILKTEPSTYSYDDLQHDKKTVWDGVRNYQARNNLMAMKKGDLCFIYHSVGPREIVGTSTVTKEAYPDPSSDDPRWVAVELKVGEQLKAPVTLDQMKDHGQLKEIQLVKQSRLSVSPINKADAKLIMELSTSRLG